MTNQQLPFAYNLFGCRVHSSLELPELLPIEVEEEIPKDFVEVVEGSVPSDIKGGQRVNSWMAVGNSICLYSIPGVGRLLVENGNHITVDLNKNALQSDMRSYLLGSGFGALLHQRKYVPLHVSAVKTPSGIIAFSGESGAGKSTIAGLLNRKTGWPLVTDDVAVLRQQADIPLLDAGLMRIKLWKDAVKQFGAASETITRDVARYDKFHVYAPQLFTKTPDQLIALIILERGDKSKLIDISGARRLEAMLKTIYRPELISIFNDDQRVFKKCSSIADQISFLTLVRPWSQTGLHASIDLIAERFGLGKTHVDPKSPFSTTLGGI